MRYSVIIPVYNAEATLRRCLDSLVNQQFSDYELLLINDGSTDGSGAICREYADKYPQIRYLSKENGGVSSARNLGLEQAGGEYILFADSDDFVSEGYLAAISDALKDGSPDLLMFGYRNLGGASSGIDAGVFREEAEPDIARQIYSAMRRYIFGSLWSKAFKRNIIEQHNIRFENDLSIGEDQAFIFAYAMHLQSIASVGDRLYNVDVSNGGSLSRKACPYLTEQLLEVNRRMYAALRASGHSQEATRYYEKALSWTAYRSAYSCCKELLKLGYPAKRRRQEIRRICRLYRAEGLRTAGWRCRLIAMPVRMEWSRVIDWLICFKAR